jgi:predicted lipoprotein with Yx(FWY)xxD motif
MLFTRTRSFVGGVALLMLAGCGGAAATSASGGSSGGGASNPGAANATVASAVVGGHGTVLVAGSNKMTLYQFTKDVANSGVRACTGACITRWPALTVPPGSSPSASVSGGKWGTIVRSDGGGTQVTYNGLPLYFFSGDSKPGDANGNYPGWSVVTATAGSGSSGGGGSVASPTSSGSGGYGY